MPIPFEPEPLSDLKDRFPKALEKIWDATTSDMPDRPGLHREHVFDFEDGVRLLISKDKILVNDEEEISIHVSASWEINEPQNLEHAHAIVSRHYILLGGKGILVFLGASSSNIPHWLVVEKPPAIRAETVH